VWIADLWTGEEHHIGAGAPMGWYDNETLFLNDSTGYTGLESQIYQTKVGTWTRQSMGIDPTDAAGNVTIATEGHWGTWLGAEHRIVRDGVLVRSGDAYGLEMAGNWWLTARPTDWATEVYQGTTLHRVVTPLTPANASRIGDSGWVAYLGAAGIYVAPPTGAHHRVTAASASKWEGLGPLVEHNGDVWLWTGGGPADESAYYAYGRKASETDSAPDMAVQVAGPLYLSVVAGDTGWVIAGTTDRGTLAVTWVAFDTTPGTPSPSDGPPETPYTTPPAGPTPLTTLPTLKASDRGFLLFIPDYGHLLRWSGTRWEFATGEGNAFYADFAVAPTNPGWVKCDGKTTTYLVIPAVKITARRITLPTSTRYFRR
jgi:hypothetical protein